MGHHPGCRSTLLWKSGQPDACHRTDDGALLLMPCFRPLFFALPVEGRHNETATTPLLLSAKR